MFLHDPITPAAVPALFDASEGRWYSHSDLWAEVDRLAAVLRGSGKGLVFCYCRNDFASVSVYLGSVEAGHAVALLDAGLAAEFQARLISLYRPDLIVSSAAAPVTGNPEGEYENDDAGGASVRVLRRRKAAGGEVHPDLAVLLSTSGSTGSPKFVRLTANNLLANARAICAGLQIRREDRAISSLAFHYSYGLSVLHTHLLAGAAVILTNESLLSPQFWKVFRETHCTSFAGVPYSFEVLRRLGLEELNIPSLHTLTQAGGKLRNDLIRHFHEAMVRRGGRFFVMYGQTEASPRIATLPHECLPAKLGSAGKTLAGGRFEIDIDGILTVEPAESGELIYSGPNVMMGYATSREDLALGDVMHGRLPTGDLAHLDADGFVYIEGRMKRDAKLLGLRINLDEIENMLLVHGPTAVIAARDKLIIYGEYGDEQAVAQYRRELAAMLNINYQALEFHRVERLPLNANGKIDYQALGGV